MGKYLIRGGKRLSGEISITGGKNAILPILAASVLNSNISVIKNCPKLSDAFASQKILEAIGCSVQWDGNTMIIDSSQANCCEVPEHLMREMRSSVIFLGSVLGRFNMAKISLPGGCELGPRPIDFHLKALRQLGAVITEEKGYIICETKGLKGTPITLDFPSVGATENIMLASVFAEGKTVIINAAKEPEIVDLQNFLNGMGADIYGAGSDTVIIKGVKSLKNVIHTVMPDRIVAGTYLTAAAITGGSVRLNNIDPKHLQPIISKLKETGCTITEGVNFAYLKSPAKLKAINKIRTHPHPGFPNCNKSIHMMPFNSRAETSAAEYARIFLPYSHCQNYIENENIFPHFCDLFVAWRRQFLSKAFFKMVYTPGKGVYQQPYLSEQKSKYRDST